MAKEPPELMNVREVARYLGINEKKIYFLAKNGKIPCTRVTGKWAFPKNLVAQWIERSASGMAARSSFANERPYILAAGSDDPSLGILRELFETQTGRATFFMATVGSSAGLAALREDVVDVATAHLLQPVKHAPEANLASNDLPGASAVIAMFHRELGLLVRPGNPFKLNNLRDLARGGVRFANRQIGSGTRIYLDRELLRLRIKPQSISGYDSAASTHIEVGLKILGGAADAGLASRTAAQLLGLEFLPLTRERFDLWVRKEKFFDSRIQSLLAVIGSREFRQRVNDLGGYDVNETGRMVHLEK